MAEAESQDQDQDQDPYRVSVDDNTTRKTNDIRSEVTASDSVVSEHK